MRAILFDLDGTLTQSEEGIYNSVIYAAEQLGQPAPEAATLRRFIGPPLAVSFSEFMHLSPEDTAKAVALFRERYIPIGAFENRVYPGIRRLLRLLKKRGDYVAVATGKLNETAQRVVDYFGLRPFMDAVIGHEDHEDPGKKHTILRALPPEYDEAWMIGDRKFDILGGAEAGVKTIGVGFGYGSKEELEGAGCDYYAATVQDLTDFLCPGETDDTPGAFLSFEGIDGCGKTTQLQKLKDGLERCGFEVVMSREPGGCKVAEAIRSVLLDPANMGMTRLTETMLYAASRAQYVSEVVRPALAAGKVFISDRYVDSSAAYQGGGRQIGVERVMEINREAVDGLMPMLTIYLRISHEESLRRMAGSRPDRIEAEGSDFFKRVADAYDQLAADQKERFLTIPGVGEINAIAAQILSGVRARLTEAGL